MDRRRTIHATHGHSNQGSSPVPLAAVVFGGLIAISAAFTAHATESRTPADYFATRTGDVYLYEVHIHANGVPQWQRWIFQSVGEPADCDGAPCTSFSWKENATFEGRALPEISGRFFQRSNESESCTWGYVDDDGETVSEDCAYKDLLAPIEKGTRWGFRVTYPIHALEYSGNPMISYTAEIVETGLTLTAAGTEYRDCIQTHQVGRAQPQETITCADGTTSTVRLEVTLDRWFCPVIGEVKTTSVENHVRVGPQSGVCSSYEISAFVRSYTPTDVTGGSESTP